MEPTAGSARFQALRIWPPPITFPLCCMNSHRLLLKHLAFGFIAGAITSIVPIELAVLVVPGFLILWIFATRRRPTSCGITSYVVAGIAALATISTAALLPVKHLDQRVGPILYGRMSLDDLCQALSKDYRVFASAPYPQSLTQFLAFHTDREMTRREVLQKLAADTDFDLHIGYCGSGASFLFGSHPSFTSLKVQGAQPEGPANWSQPARSETNGTSAAAGSAR